MSVWLLLSTLWATINYGSHGILFFHDSVDKILRTLRTFTQHMFCSNILRFLATLIDWGSAPTAATRLLSTGTSSLTSDLYTFICADGWQGWHEARGVPTCFGSPNTTVSLEGGSQPNSLCNIRVVKMTKGTVGFGHRLGKRSLKVEVIAAVLTQGVCSTMLDPTSPEH